MKHDEIVEIAKNWLKKQYPPPAKVSAGEIDLIVNAFQRFWEEEKLIIKTHLQIECKKTEDHEDPAIGQCLRYYTNTKGLFTYLAVPEDYQRLKELESVLEFVNLPIGLMLVYYSGEVKIKRKAEGKEILTTVDLKGRSTHE